jgi:predicted RNA-binding Zn-ribbon protein involved in translation (DUF1610 family)
MTDDPYYFRRKVQDDSYRIICVDCGYKILKEMCGGVKCPNCGRVHFLRDCKHCPEEYVIACPCGKLLEVKQK